MKLENGTIDREQLFAADLTSDAVYFEIRRNVLRPLLANKSYDSAIEVLERLISADPSRTRERSELASVCLRNKQPAKAVKTIIELQEDSPASPELTAQTIQILISADQVGKAAELALDSELEWATSGRLADMAMRALSRNGDAASALAASGHSAALNVADPKIVARAAATMNAAGQASEARDAIRTAIETSGEAPELNFELGRALFLLERRSVEALKRLEAAWVQASADKRIGDLYSRALHANGRPKEAVAVIEECGSFQSGAPARMLYARCLKGAGRHDEAAEQMMQIVSANPADVTARRYAAGMAAMAGRMNDAVNIYAEGIEQRRSRLPATLAEGISNISNNLEKANIPVARFDWAWRQMEQMGSEPSDRSEWERQVRRNNLVDYLILDWLECNPEESSQVVELIDGIPEATATLNTALKSGRGVFLAGAHIGALFAAPAAIVSSGLNAAWVASTPDFSKESDQFKRLGTIISTTVSEAGTIARKIVRSMSQGEVINIAIDGSGMPDLPQYDLFDRKINLSDFIPRVVYRSKSANFFSNLVWENDRIRVCLIELPIPTENETEADFCNRWMAAYINEIKDVFASSPENLRMSGGFWSAIAH